MSRARDVCEPEGRLMMDLSYSDSRLQRDVRPDGFRSKAKGVRLTQSSHYAEHQLLLLFGGQ